MLCSHSRPGGAAEDICRSRHHVERAAFPTVAEPPAEAEKAGCEERDRDDVLEHRLVAMPADRRSRRIFGDQDLLQAFRCESGDLCGAFAQRQKELGQRCRWTDLPSRIVVAPAERDDPASAQEAVEFERRRRAAGPSVRRSAVPLRPRGPLRDRRSLRASPARRETSRLVVARWPRRSTSRSARCFWPAAAMTASVSVSQTSGCAFSASSTRRKEAAPDGVPMTKGCTPIATTVAGRSGSRSASRASSLT